MRVLRRVPERQLTGSATPLGQRRSRLHRVRNQPLLNDALLDDDLGVPERGVDVAAGDRPVKGLVVGNVGVELGGARLECGLRVGDRWQRLVLDIDELERVVGLTRRFGHDDGHDVADIADGVARDGLVAGDLQAGIRQQPGAWNGLQGLGICSAVYSHDTGAAWARLRSIRVIRAWACGLRSIAAWSIPGSVRSSV